MQYLRLMCIAVLVISFSCLSAFGQAVNGNLVGTVTDSTGGLVTGAKVTIVENGTGSTRSGTTNERGGYAFSIVEPGTYRVTVEYPGFRSAIVSGVEVQVNATARMDLVLQAGSVNESVTVKAETATLQTDRSDTGRKIETVQLANLPTGYSRSFQSLLNLVPGTSRSFEPHSEFFNSQGSLTTQVNGVSRIANNVQFEGVDNNHRSGLLTAMIPPIEALQTVDVTTSNYDAELGRAGGAVTNIQLKSGSNAIHGGAYWFHSNQRLVARETFQPSKPVTTYNYYGFNVGGPVIKNKTFFFGDYLEINDRRGDGYIITVPGAAQRAGDFSALASRAIVYNPTTGNRDTGVGRQPFADNKIPEALISPIARRILALTPLPNLGAGITNNFSGATTRKRDQASFDVKVDHAQSDKDRFSVRYSLQRPVVTDPGRFGIAGGGGKGFAATGINRAQSAAVNYTRLWSPTLVMELRMGLSRYSNRAENLDIGTDAAKAIGIPGANLDRHSSGLSSINVGGYANPLVGYSASIPWNRAETNFDYVGNFTKMRGSHTFKFGANFRRGREELLQTQDAGGSRGEFQFRSNTTSIPGAVVLDQVNALASLLLDTPSTIQRDLAVQFPTNRVYAFYSYFQDTWQVNQKLTLNLGVRHDFYPPNTPRGKGGWSNFDFLTNTFKVAGYGDTPLNLGRQTYYTNFAPRIGVAYRYNPKTVVRAGFGISWIPFPDNKLAWDNFPVKQSNSFAALGTFGQAQTTPGVYGSMTTGFPSPVTVAIPANGLIPGNTPGLLSANVSSAIPLDYHEGYIESWNFAVQRQLPKNFTLDVTYVGNHTVRAPVAYNVNAGLVLNAGAAGRPLFAAYGKNADVLLRYVGFSNNYNSMQVKIDRRFSGGFMVTTAYTYGKALGYSSETGGLWNYIQPQRSYARLDFDRAHTFVQSYLYELPFGTNKPFLKSGVGKWVLGDWQVNGVLTLMTGRPVTFGTNVSANAPGNALTPDQVGDIDVTHAVAGTLGTATWFNTSNLRQPLNADGKTPHFGNLGRNNFDGPGLFNIDFSLFRKFQITERFKAELRGEATNFTNTPAFAQPNTTVGSADFGKITTTLAGLIANQGTGGTGSRQIQVALKITF